MPASSTSIRQSVVATLTSVGSGKRVIVGWTRSRSGVPILMALICMTVALASTGSAWAFQALPSGAQVNDDAAAGIDKAVNVNGEGPTNADVVGGALSVSGPAVPWAVFRQETNGSPTVHDQIFVRSFANGAWTTRGDGTVGGRSSASSQPGGWLNFDQAQDGEAPAIDFAGAGRTVPWATWYEQTSGAGFANNNIFASRFDNTGDANQGKWIFGGQSRGVGGGTVPVPSLNIHTDQDAENPSIAGGSASNPTRPTPWVTWQETTAQPLAGKDQVFVTRASGPGAVNCDGTTPQGAQLGGHVPAIGGFCWQQVGIGRVGPAGADPSLNVDPTRDGVEPDIAFAGANDSVPWVVWYEKGTSGVAGLHANELVFAAKGVSDSVAVNGGFHWVAVGSELSSTLDTSGTGGFGGCAQSASNEAQCSLNKNASSDAEDVRIAAGTMSAASPTVPWVTWDEVVAGVRQVFVARLHGTGSSAHFELANGGQPISTGAHDSTRPDIAFAGNTPYISWREDVGGGVEQSFHGHFVDSTSPTFVLDQSDVPLTPNAQADVREPISSTCIATPFNTDGAACQGGALGTPFFLFTSGTSPLGLFASAYQADPVTGAASSVSSSSATVSGMVNPEGASVNVSFQYGSTTAYGQTTAAQSSAVSNAAQPFVAAITGLPVGSTIHYRVVAVSDFGTFAGGDQTLSTAAPSPSPSSPSGSSATPVNQAKASASAGKVSGSSVSVGVSCTGPATAACPITVKLTVTETLKGHKLLAVTARSSGRKLRKVVVVGTAKITLDAGQVKVVRVALNRAGKRLLASRGGLKAKLRVTQLTAAGVVAVATQTVTFKPAKRNQIHGRH